MTTSHATHDTILLKVSIQEQPDQVLSLPHPMDEANLKALTHLPRSAEGVYNLTAPLVNLRKFRANHVDLRMPPGLSSDQYIQRYLQAHHQVFEVLTRAEKMHRHTRRELITTKIKTVIIGFILLACLYLLHLTGILQSYSGLMDPPERLAAGAILLSALLFSPIYLLQHRLGTIERRFLNGHQGLAQLGSTEQPTP